MSVLPRLLRGLVFCSLLSLVLSLQAEAAEAPEQRDQKVLAAALSSLLTEQDCNLTAVSTPEATLLLEARSPDKTGLIRSDQIQQELSEEHVLSAGILKSLRLRNEKPGTYETLPVFYTGLNFGRRIVVSGTADRSDFQRDHPKARAWVRAWLPGYSSDGKQAVVRAVIGPTPHGAVVTVFLERHNGEWRVAWHHLALFV